MIAGCCSNVLFQVHGANFSVHVDGRGKLLCAKRRGFLAEHEDFFGHFAMLCLASASHSLEPWRLTNIDGDDKGGFFLKTDLCAQDQATKIIASIGSRHY